MLMISAIVSIILTIVKCFFWLLKEMFRLLWYVYRIFLSLFPVAGIILAILIILEVAGYASEKNLIPQNIPNYLTITADAAPESEASNAAQTSATENAAQVPTTADATQDSSASILPSKKVIVETIQKQLSNSFVFDKDSGIGSSASPVAGSSGNTDIAQDVTNGIANSVSDEATKQVTGIADLTAKTILQQVADWWGGILKQTSSSGLYYLMLFITALLGIPATILLLILSAIGSGRDFLAAGLFVDMMLYVIRSICTSQTPFMQFKKRYRFLFNKPAPAPAPVDNAQYESAYKDWLKRHHEEFKNDTFDGYGGYVVYGDDDEEPRWSREQQRQEAEDRFYYQEEPGDDPDGFYDDDEEEARENEDRDDDAEYEDRDDDAEYDDEYEDGDDAEYDDEYEDGDDAEEADADREENEYDEEDGNPDDASNDENAHNSSGRSFHQFNFFAGCSSKESVTKKYHALVKIYHPDNTDGDSAALQEIIKQYKSELRKYA